MAALTVDDIVTALVAEADEAFAQRVSSALADHDDLKVVATATSGRGAVEQLLELMPDAALLDLRLPDVDGLDACRTVHALAPATALVVLARPQDDDRAFAALCEGASACVTIDTPLDEVGDALRGATRGECVLPGAVAARVLDGLERIAAAQPPHAAVGRAPAATDTEREVLACLAQGETPDRIADRYDVTTRLVNLHTGFAVAKLQRWTETRRQVSRLT
jgi:DNA-binding NarL/FixJ family response regulator